MLLLFLFVAGGGGCWLSGKVIGERRTKAILNGFSQRPIFWSMDSRCAEACSANLKRSASCGKGEFVDAGPQAIHDYCGYLAMDTGGWTEVDPNEETCCLFENLSTACAGASDCTEFGYCVTYIASTRDAHVDAGLLNAECLYGCMRSCAGEAGCNIRPESDDECLARCIRLQWHLSTGGPDASSECKAELATQARCADAGGCEVYLECRAAAATQLEELDTR